MLEPPRASAEVPYTPCEGEDRVGSKRFDVLEPPRSSAEAPYTSLSWCGSCRFAVLEPPRSSAAAPYTHC